MLTEERLHKIADLLERQADKECNNALSYHRGYKNACEDFVKLVKEELSSRKESG